ncbi:cellulase family glycosylhydrolase [Sediminicola luteus]|uniref:Glycosyl hydrolase family 5 n=1 Tax=Sediminicola luteus TaxID=319238 RepID=A0A2A4G3F7_9FLAO|nr:cellulase family glycosylhydrolase [Sediminicola luteus]PCE62518.1 glycosyl hydrolase family 5 [Sediminicola luteus]
MNTTKIIYRTFLVGSFVAINTLIIYGISASWNFLNTGADRSKMLHLTQKLELAYLPKMHWDLDGQKGRPMNKQALKELEADYRSAWYVKNMAFRNNDPFGLDDFFTKSAKAELLALLNLNIQNGVSQRSTTITHHIQLEFYSLDGKMAILTDHMVTGYQETYQRGELTYAGPTQNSYRVMLLLEDGFWRIRQMIKTKGEEVIVKPTQVGISIGALKGINYYPKSHPWEMFGKHHDPAILDADFMKLKLMGFNSIRIFIPYETFGRAHVDETQLKQILELMDIAAEKDLKVLITLFDFFGEYDMAHWTLAHRHAEKLVTTLKGHRALLGWDIKNEPDLDFDNYGKREVLTWLELMINRLREWDDVHPITIGWSTPEAAVSLKEMVDFISFHYYGPLEEFDNRFSVLREKAKGKSMVLQEFGKSSYKGIWNAYMGSDEAQLEYMRGIKKRLDANDLSFYIWTLHDFENIPNKVVGPRPWRKAHQRNFGLLDVLGKEKPVSTLGWGN